LAYLRLASIYFGIGLISGVVSGASTELKPLGLILPGPVFGVFFAFASMLAERPLKLPVFFVCLAALGFFASDFAFFLSVGFADDIMGGRAIAGGICGGVGAFAVSIHSALFEQTFDWVLILAVSAVGCLLGAGIMPLVIQLKDNGSVAEPLGFILLFTTWQAGTMLTLGLLRQRFAASSNPGET
jgi:hypothetical protein